MQQTPPVRLCHAHRSEGETCLFCGKHSQSSPREHKVPKALEKGMHCYRGLSSLTKGTCVSKVIKMCHQKS